MIAAAGCLLYTSVLAAAEHTIRLTALVHDAEGRVSSALAASDFVVREDSESLRITSFRNLRPPQELIEKRPPKEYTISNRPLAAFESRQPTSVIVLDTRNTDPEFQPWMHGQALRFISMLRPDADVAFYQFSASGLHLLHEFSHEKPKLSKALDTVLEPGAAAEFERESSSGFLRAERYRKTCEALSAMAEYLAAFGGRKNLLWMAADFPPVFARPSEECDAMALALNRSNTALYPVDVRSPVTKEPFQPVVPGDLRKVPHHRRQALSREWLNTMTNLAALTGGRAIRNRSQLAEAMIDAVNETRFAYELGFAVPAAQCDGRLHPLNVAVKMPDTAVLAKQAFAADCNRNEQPPPPEPFDAPGIGITVMPTIERGADATVHLKVLIAPSDLQWTGASVDVTVEEMKAGGPGRTLLSRTVGPVPMELTVKPGPDVQAMRVLVRNRVSRRQGSVTFPLNHQPQ